MEKNIEKIRAKNVLISEIIENFEVHLNVSKAN